MKLSDALKRIEELERRVAQLEARPPAECHNHYHTYAPPIPHWQVNPLHPYAVWCTGAGSVGHLSGREQPLKAVS